jgi:hypothetical protein
MYVSYRVLRNIVSDCMMHMMYISILKAIRGAGDIILSVKSSGLQISRQYPKNRGSRLVFYFNFNFNFRQRQLAPPATTRPTTRLSPPFAPPHTLDSRIDKLESCVVFDHTGELFCMNEMINLLASDAYCGSRISCPLEEA